MNERYPQPIIKEICLRNLLSFGPDTEPLQLQNLNVLIGANGVGKSNLIEALSIVGKAPRELTDPIREGGGVREWLWKGAPGRVTATIEVVLNYPLPRKPLRYRLSFTEARQRLEVTDERIEDAEPRPGAPIPNFYFGYERGRPMLNVNEERRALRREDIDPQQSILSQRKDPDLYPEITWVGNLFGRIRFYREWRFGRYTPPRLPQPVDLPNEFLAEDASNLGLILNRLRRKPQAKKMVLDNLRLLYDEAQDIDVSVEGGTVQVFLEEQQFTVPATRLSDGTLRWLALLTILLHPDPPPLVCIEEPELGLHPDMMPSLARLLQDASQRMQLVITTHSDGLVDALTPTPEAVIVCEKEAGSTVFQRLESEPLARWVSDYGGLARVWRSREIGGNRW